MFLLSLLTPLWDSSPFDTSIEGEKTKKTKHFLKINPVKLKPYYLNLSYTCLRGNRPCLVIEANFTISHVECPRGLAKCRFAETAIE